MYNGTWQTFPFKGQTESIGMQYQTKERLKANRENNRILCQNTHQVASSPAPGRTPVSI